jgi:hypothetical protein
VLARLPVMSESRKASHIQATSNMWAGITRDDENKFSLIVLLQESQPRKFLEYIWHTA